MIRFNIIGSGFVDMQAGSGLSFKRENQWFRFADISLGRSVEFAIPATNTNRRLFGFGEDPSEYGDMLRKSLECQMIYDGGLVNGTLNVTGYEGDVFKCVFLLDNAEWINTLQGLKLSDCVTSFDKGVLWAANLTPTDADQADPTVGCLLLRYDNGSRVSTSAWQLVPSVNISMYIDDILTTLGVPHSLEIPKDLWMVAGSMKGGTIDAVTINITGTNAATVTQTQDYLDVVDISLEWARTNVFGIWTGGGSQAAKAFKAVQDVLITFPSSFPSGVIPVVWNSRLGKCVPQGEGTSFAGKTIDLATGEIVFFADHRWIDVDSGGTYYGWKDVFHPLTATFSVERNEDLTLGEVWYLRNNHPDMTVFEFLKSVALATGLELTVTAEGGVTMRTADYGNGFRSLERVVSVDAVTRNVSAWGGSAQVARVLFDNEDYVTDPLVAIYPIDNELLTDTKDFKSGFSVGNAGSLGAVIKDVDFSGSQPKFVGKRWTLARSVAGETFLQRIDTPSATGYDDIATNSTCVKVKALADEAAFFSLQPGHVFVWRGMAYIWTEAQWSSGVLSLTLQKVSQQF